MRARLATLLLLSLGLSARAQDFVRTVAAETPTGVTCVTWSVRDYTYHVDAAGSLRTPGDTEFTAIDAAFSTWQAVSDGCSDFHFTRGPRVVDPRVGLGTEDTNVITFREKDCGDVVAPGDPCLADGSCANSKKCWDHSSATIGLTTSTFSTRTGIVYDSDIELNASGYLFTTISSPKCEAGKEAPTCAAYDVQNTVTHEAGHVVGLAHVSAATSTMAATAPLGDVAKRVIDPGTAQGFCSTYPAGRPPVPCDGLAVTRMRINAVTLGAPGCTCGPGAGGEPFALLMAWCLWLGLRRRQ